MTLHLPTQDSVPLPANYRQRNGREKSRFVPECVRIEMVTLPMNCTIPSAVTYHDTILQRIYQKCAPIGKCWRFRQKP